MNQRPPIPPEIKREVRQRCGFGCVICGLPLYEYEHMLEWAQVHRHVAEEITLLCRQHHGEKTNRLLPKEAVMAADRDPYNKRAGVSTNYLLHYSGDSVMLSIGGSTLSYKGMVDGLSFCPLMIDGCATIFFKKDQGRLFLNFAAFDEFNRQIVSIVENEIVYDTAQWDAEWVGQSLTLRESHRKILMKITFNPPAEIKIEKGRILRNGIEILIGEKYVFISNTGTFISGIKTLNCAVGISLGDPKPDCGIGISIPYVPRYQLDMKGARQFLRACLTRDRNN